MRLRTCSGVGSGIVRPPESICRGSVAVFGERRNLEITNRETILSVAGRRFLLAWLSSAAADDARSGDGASTRRIVDSYGDFQLSCRGPGAWAGRVGRFQAQLAGWSRYHYRAIARGPVLARAGGGWNRVRWLPRPVPL